MKKEVNVKLKGKCETERQMKVFLKSCKYK